MIEKVKQQYRRIISAGDSSTKIALGYAIGIFVAWTPTLGLQMIIAGLLAWAASANKPAAILAVWITNPYTAIPIYWLNYQLGAILMHRGVESKGEFIATYEAAASTKSFDQAISYYWEAFNSIAAPLWVGSLVAGVFLGVCGFFATRFLVDKHRAHKLLIKKQINSL